MAKDNFSDMIYRLFQKEDWVAARRLLQRDLNEDPDNHWLLTQLGVSFYEERQYKKALKLLLKSQAIMPDCPLTLWNLAGALDALGKHAAAVRIYRGLLESKKTPEEDPCWESREWTDSLKADCVYRLGVSFEHLGKKRKAEQCYRQFLDLLLSGIKATYSSEDVLRRIKKLHANGKNGVAAGALRRAVREAVQLSRSAI